LAGEANKTNNRRGPEQLSGNGRRKDRFEPARLSHAEAQALRAELTEAWRPRNALDQQLIDQLAQWQSLLAYWQEMLTSWAMVWRGVDKRRKEDFQAPRVSQAEALEQAARMVERYHRLYLQTLRALQNLRRQGPPVVVRRAGQVNIAAQQQVNLTEG
jgi:hypothetical protein